MIKSLNISKLLNVSPQEGFTCPVVVFNKSHSGSRLLARLLESAGVFLGSNQNESNDSMDVLNLVRYLINEYYPDFSPLWQPGSYDTELETLIEQTFCSHLQQLDPNKHKRWGWKLCETTYILPVIDFLFPKAKYIHLIRDGRDVAFSPHRAPHHVFWRKVYFNTGHIEEWRGLKMTKEAYRKKSHLYNALHWQNSVLVGRCFGAMLRERYIEVKYEDLCLRFDEESKRILTYLQLECSPNRMGNIRKTVRADSVGKHKRQSRKKNREVLELIKPQLLAFGYLKKEKGST